MDAYGYCYNNPILLTDPTGMGPEPAPFFAEFKIFAFSQTITGALRASVNSSTNQLYLWATGQQNSIVAKNNIKGAVGEGIAMNRLTNDFGYKSGKVISPNLVYSFGQKYNGKQIDIQSRVYTTKLNIGIGKISLPLTINAVSRSFNFDGTEGELKSFFKNDTWFTFNYEVKTWATSSNLEQLADNYINTMNEMIGINSKDNDVGVLITDTDTWKAVGNSKYGNKLKTTYDEFVKKGNVLRLENNLSKDADKAMYSLKDKINGGN